MQFVRMCKLEVWTSDYDQRLDWDAICAYVQIGSVSVIMLSFDIPMQFVCMCKLEERYVDTILERAGNAICAYMQIGSSL